VRKLPQGNRQHESEAAGSARSDARREDVAEGEVLAE